MLIFSGERSLTGDHERRHHADRWPTFSIGDANVSTFHRKTPLPLGSVFLFELAQELFERRSG